MERCSDSEIELGTVYAAEFGLSLYSQIDRYSLYDATVKIYYSLTLSDGVVETIPMGIYEVSEANRKIKTLELKGYDYMLRFDKTLKLESSSGTGGHADESKLSCITSIEYKINGKESIKCVGKNPRLARAKSKNDKNISGLINSMESGKTIIYNFVNVSPFVIGQSLTNVMDIDFTATEDTTAAFQCEMLLEVIKPDGEEPEEMPELSVVYKMNNETIDGFMPIKTCLYGKHIVTLFFPISKVIENSSNTFSMYLKISHGSITIAGSDC